MNEKKKTERIDIRVSQRFKERFLDFLSQLEEQGINMNMTDFVYQAITEKMKRMGTLANKNNVLKQIKEMSRKLNGVQGNMKKVDTKIEERMKSIEKATKEEAKKSKFDTYEDIDNKIKAIDSVLQEHRAKQSYITYKYTGDTLGCKIPEIVEKSKLPKTVVWDIIQHLKESDKIVKCKNGGWDLNV